MTWLYWVVCGLLGSVDPAGGPKFMLHSSPISLPGEAVSNQEGDVFTGSVIASMISCARMLTCASAAGSPFGVSPAEQPVMGLRYGSSPGAADSPPPVRAKGPGVARHTP